MKKIFTLLAVAAMAVTASAQEKEWNISDWEAADYTAEATIDGFTIYASETGKVSVDANNKTVNDVKYTKRLKTGGAGSKSEEGLLSRVLSFDVPSDGTVSFIACSSNGSDDRICGVSFGEFVPFPVADDNGDVPPTPETINTVDVLTGNPAVHEVAYAGGVATKVYIYSKSGGINFYDFKFTPGNGDSGIAAIAAENAPVEYFNLQGVRVDNPANGLYIRRQGNNVTKVIVK